MHSSTWLFFRVDSDWFLLSNWIANIINGFVFLASTIVAFSLHSWDAIINVWFFFQLQNSRNKCVFSREFGPTATGPQLITNITPTSRSIPSSITSRHPNGIVVDGDYSQTKFPKVNFHQNHPALQSSKPHWTNGKCGEIIRPMLSAVENHFGPGRPYATHPYGTGPNLLAPCPMPALSSAEFVRPHPKPSNRFVPSPGGSGWIVDGDYHNFHHHSRYNGGPPLRGCNGISSPRSKYSLADQNGPVNLAVTSQQSQSVSQQSLTATTGVSRQSPQSSKQSSQSSFNEPTSGQGGGHTQQSQSDQDAMHHSLAASLYGSGKMSYPQASNGASVAAALQALSYPSLYTRGPYGWVVLWISSRCFVMT